MSSGDGDLKNPNPDAPASDQTALAKVAVVAPGQEAPKPPKAGPEVTVLPPAQPKPPIASQISISAASFSGPLPPPVMLQQYNQVFPGCGERIVRMAEA